MESSQSNISKIATDPTFDKLLECDSDNDIEVFGSESGEELPGGSTRWKKIAKFGGALLFLSLVASCIVAGGGHNLRGFSSEGIVDLAASQTVSFQIGMLGISHSDGKVTAVDPDSPADRAGVQVGWVVQSVGGIKGGSNDVFSQAKAAAYKKFIEGKSSSVILKIVFGKPSGTKLISTTKSIRLDQLGITYQASKSKDKITSVERNSNAAVHGLKKNNVLLSINGESAAKTTSGLTKQLKEAKREAFSNYLKGQSAKITMQVQ